MKYEEKMKISTAVSNVGIFLLCISSFLFPAFFFPGEVLGKVAWGIMATGILCLLTGFVAKKKAWRSLPSWEQEQIKAEKREQERKVEAATYRYYINNMSLVKHTINENGNDKEIYAKQLVDRSNGVVDFDDARQFVNMLCLYSEQDKNDVLRDFENFFADIVKKHGPISSTIIVPFFYGVLNSNGIIDDVELENMSKNFIDNLTREAYTSK